MIETVPASTEIQLRARALIAFALLSGARDRAIISFKLKHIDIENELVEQDARDVRTKRAKTFTTWFFPIGKDFRHVFVEWVAFLRERKGFGPEDPLFPKSKVGPGEDLEFRAVGLDRAHWANANPIRAIFREACRLAGLPYFNPHSLRSTLVQLAYELKLDAEQFKAWSQNLGHENCLTTFSSYGQLPPAKQAEIIRGLAGSTNEADDQTDLEQLRELAEKLARRGKAA
jgi:integrase